MHMTASHDQRPNPRLPLDACTTATCSYRPIKYRGLCKKVHNRVSVMCNSAISQ